MEKVYEDITLNCREIVDGKEHGMPFVFTAGEQKFYEERGLTQPKRCPTCRIARKSQMKTGQPYKKPVIYK